MFLPVIIPLLNFSISTTESISVISEGAIYKVIDSGSAIDQSFLSRLDLEVSTILFLFWVVTAIFMLVRTIYGVIKTLSIIQKGERIKGTNIVLTENDYSPFSFWKFIVLPRNIYENGDCREIIAHEEAHIAQKHTLDLLLSELYIAFFWFNPVAWLIKKSVVLNHEYLADSASVAQSTNTKYYQYSLLNLKPGLLYIPITHNYKSNIKNRIVMMNKKPTRDYAVWKNMLILPAILFLFAVFSCESTPGGNSIEQQSEFSSEFSTDSWTKMLIPIYQKVIYPQEAREAGTVGQVYVIVKTGSNGKIKSIAAVDGSDDPGVSNILHEVVVVGYGNPNSSSNDLNPLKKAAEDACKVLENLDIPELKNGKMEFAIPFTFTLQPM
jgi:beta-lactamase regulating signal transducer with metallopeptidase domain